MASSECVAMRAKLSAYLDGELDDATCHVLLAHVNECADCTTFFNTLKKTLSLYQNLPPDKMTADARERLLNDLNLKNRI